MLRTYGVRDIETAQVVDARTQFSACSITKSLTAAGILLLFEDLGLPLAARVAELLPDFALSDPAVTKHLQVSDLLCHASGLPRHDRIWTPGDLSADAMVHRMRYLALSSGLRERFQYNNLGYVALACMARGLAGRNWEDHMTESLLRRLGFRDFGWSPPALRDAPNHAHPHVREGDVICRGSLWPAPAASGGLTASIADLGGWLQALIDGELAGIEHERWRRVRTQMTTPWIPIDAPSAHPEIDASHYGLGLCYQHYRGRPMITHTGSMPGWGSLLAYLPHEQVGVVVLTNRDPSPVTQLLALSVFDALCGPDPIDWYARHAELRREALAEELARHELAAPAAPIEAPRPLADYTGSYAEPAYGTVRVSAAADGLIWQWRGFSGPVIARGTDVFAMRETLPARHADGFTATFRSGSGGDIESLEIPHEPEVAPIVFRRAH